MRRASALGIFAAFLATVVMSAAAVALVKIGPGKPGIANHGAKLNVVAGENFWGSIVAQIGGTKVQVMSVVSDPNADPHEYESDTKTARAVATADYAVFNGGGYDAWGDKLLAASPNMHRKVLSIAGLLGKHSGDNPHFWYNPTYVNIVAKQVASDLSMLDPSATAYFRGQLANVQRSFNDYQSRIAGIAQLYSGTEVVATEDIFSYLASAAQLNLVSPAAFMQAVAEGNDPPATSVATFQQQLRSGQVKVLVFNEQTVTPLTNSIKKLADEQGVPTVGITETIQPRSASFQTWMTNETSQLQAALKQATHK